ncbi:MATE family efflux transporter, partial [uncultured Alistipes sp.]|uniref:MATE family efflux transporter n=1 Tax=uncultured Alistipes sp. TaxID=538949 RepID=UPI0025E2FF23
MRSRKRPSPLKQQLLRLAAPIFVETLLIMMLGAVDTVMLSRHSDNSVAAVGVVNQIIMLTFLVFEVINLGTSVLCSQYIGARLDKKVTQVVGISLMVNLVVGLAVSALLYFGCHTILRWMGLGSELLADGVDYMRIVGAFAFFQAISMTLSAGRGRPPPPPQNPGGGGGGEKKKKKNNKKRQKGKQGGAPH